MSKKSTKKAKPATKAKSKPAAKAKAKPAVKKAKPVVKAKAPAKKIVAKPAAKKAPAKVPAKPATKAPAKPVAKVVAKAPAKAAEKKPVAAAPAKTSTPQNQTANSNKHMPFNKKHEPARHIVKTQEESGKTRYSDVELEEFRDIIMKKLEDARKELVTLQAQLTAANEHGTDDTASTFKMLEDGSDSLAKEEAGQLASRQKKFIEQLENALVRIENKTYGVCRVTGKLIPKERLRAVPHTTQSIEAKLNQYRD